MMQTNLAVIAVWAPDPAVAFRFYRDILGLTPLPQHGESNPHFDLGDVILAIRQGPPALPEKEARRFPLLAFAVPSLDDAVQNLQAQCVEMPWGLEQDASSSWVMFRDPAGNLLELVELQ